MPRKKKTTKVTMAEKPTTLSAKKTTQRKKAKSDSAKLISYIILAVMIVFIIVLVFAYKDLRNMKSQMNQVKQTVSENNQDSVGYLQIEIQRLKQQLADKEKQIQEISGIYVNKEYGLQFEIPVSADQKSGVIDDDGLIMFGATKDFGGVLLPEFSLRIFEKNDLLDYKKKIRFLNEKCEANNDCIMLDIDYLSFNEDRGQALDLLLEKVVINDLAAWKMMLEHDCLVPTVIIYNQARNTIYEFQQQCAPSEEQGFDNLQKIIETLQFID